MASVHEARTFITNLRNHLMADLGNSDWRGVREDTAKIHKYLGTLNKDGQVGDETMKKLSNLLKEIEGCTKDKDGKGGMGTFYELNKVLVQDLNIPAICGEY